MFVVAQNVELVELGHNVVMYCALQDLACDQCKGNWAVVGRYISFTLFENRHNHAIFLVLGDYSMVQRCLEYSGVKRYQNICNSLRNKGLYLIGASSLVKLETLEELVHTVLVNDNPPHSMMWASHIG